ncbi:MAG: Tic22 family protein [Nodosilinea sp.]
MANLFFRSLLRLSLTGALAGGLSWLGFSSRALALTTDQIVTKLNQIPVFMVHDAQGEQLKAISESDQKVQAPVVFLDGPTAAEVVQRLQSQGQQAKIDVVDLGTIYQQSAADGTAGPLLYFPINTELTTAEKLQPGFKGVPLFIPRRGQTDSYLPFVQGNQVSLPMFFSRDDLQTYLDWVFKDNPNGAKEIVVEVRSLEWLLGAMAAAKDTTMNNQLQQIRLFPSTKVLDFLNTIQTQQQSQPQAPASAQPQNRSQPRPAAQPRP